MSDILSETTACDLLARLFKKRGYAIMRNLMFREYGVSFHIDGWDAKKRVGFEFLTSEDDDHDDLSLAEYQTLMAAQQRGELALFILDEVEPLSAADLTETANAFLDEVEAAASTPRRKVKPIAKPTKRAAAKKMTTNKTARKKVAKTAVRTKVSAKKKAAKAARRGR
jgi:hypothetical protein